MNSIKTVQDEARRYSLKEMRQRAEREIFQYLPVYSQPAEEQLVESDFHLRRFSEKSLQINNFNPEAKGARKLPPMLRYQSQKYLQQMKSKR
jgi:hypothetical protein